MLNKAALNEHKGPVVSHSERHQVSTVTRPTKTRSRLWFSFLFPSCIKNPSTQATLGQEALFVSEGGILEVNQEAPNRRECSRKSATWRVSYRHTLESYRKSPSDLEEAD